MDYGIDVSHHNAVDDWAAVRGNNITFASIKLTEGWTWVDPAAQGHWLGSAAAGIAPGGYHYAHPGSVDAQVGHFVHHLHLYRLLDPGCMWPMLDMEADGFPDAAWFAAEFARQLRAATGTPGVLIYANLDWWTNRLNPDQWLNDPGVLLWIARYTVTPGDPGWAHPKVALHQHTSEGTVPGIPGVVDRNATIGGYDLPTFRIGAGSNPPPPAPADRSYVVAPGDTLSGIAQRFNTTVDALARMNGIADPDVIYTGQFLRY